MSTYIPLGSRTGSKTYGQVAADPNNPLGAGNWTVTFHPDDMAVNVPYFEVCHIVINGAAGSSFQVFIDNVQWDTNQNGFSNSWDPAVPLPLRPGQWLYFYWSDQASDGTPPTVVIWLRYDVEIPANRNALLGYQAQLWAGLHSISPPLSSKAAPPRRVFSSTTVRLPWVL